MDSREAELIRVGKKIRERSTPSGVVERGAPPRPQALRRSRHHAQTRAARSAGDGRWLAGAPDSRSVSWARLRSRPPSCSAGARLPISFQVDSGRGARCGRRHRGRCRSKPTPSCRPRCVSPREARSSSSAADGCGCCRSNRTARACWSRKAAADVAIAHRRGPGKWRFEAGPVTVDVTGTKFPRRLEPGGSIVRHRAEGRLGHRRRRLPAGPAPRAARRQPALVVRARAATDARRPSLRRRRRRAADLEDEVGARRGSTRVARRERARRESSEDGDWRALVAAGHYAEGVRAAERAGWTRVCRERQRRRAAGAGGCRPPVGRDGARGRGAADAAPAFPGIDQRRDRRVLAGTAGVRAARRLQPRRRAGSRRTSTSSRSGPLMGDAIGRLMEARHRAGDQPAARRDAERYLQRFPEGPTRARRELFSPSDRPPHPRRRRRSLRAARSAR